MNVSEQWRDAHIMLEDFREEVINNSYSRMETSFKFRDKFLEIKETHNSILDEELTELFDHLRFSITCCENVFMVIELLGQAKLLAELRIVD